MAKTKRKQLAALAALKVTSPEASRKPIQEHQDGHSPALNEEPNDKGLASLEVRQQRIIFWIPPLEPSPRLVNSRSFRISGTPSRKRKLTSVNEEEKISSDAEDGHVYKKYAKIILKLDSWNSKINVDAPPPLHVPPLDAPPTYAEKAYQRRKPDSRILCKERVLSVLTDNENLPASSSVPASKKTNSLDEDQHLPKSLSAGAGENLIDLAPGATVGRETSSQFSGRLGLRRRKTVSHRDLVSAKPGRQELRPEQGDIMTCRKIIIKPPRKFAVASQEEVDTCPEKTQEISSLISRRQISNSLKDTILQHRPTSIRLDVSSRFEDQRKAEKMRIDPELTAAVLRATVQVSKGTQLKRKSKLSAVLGTPKTTTESANDDLELAQHSDSPSYRKGMMSVDRLSSKINNSSSRVSKVKSQKRASAKKQDGVVRTRKRALTRTLGRRTSTTALETNSVQKLAALDDIRPDAAVPIALIDPVWNRVISSGAAVPSVDEPNEGLHHGSDVVTSSNNAALNSRSRRISFLGRHAGTAEEDPKRVNLGSIGQRENSTSRVNSGRANVNGNNQLRAKSGGAATSLQHQNGDNGHVGNNQLRAKSGGAATSWQYQNRDNGYLGNNHLRAKAEGAVTSLNHGHIGSNQLRAKFGGASASLHHQNGDNNAHIGLIRQGGKQLKPQQSRLHGSHVRNHDDVAAMVRAKLDEVGGLTEWLIGGGLGVFVDLFEERKIKEGDLLHLTMSSLKEIGVQAVGPRRKLIWMIEHLL